MMFWIGVIIVILLILLVAFVGFGGGSDSHLGE